MDEVTVQLADEAPPAELRRFNWAALLFPVLWSLAQGPRIWALVFFLAGMLTTGQVLWIGLVPFLTVGASAGSLGLSLDVLARVLGVQTSAVQLWMTLVGVPVLLLQIWYGFKANTLLWRSRDGNVDWTDVKRTQRVILIGVLLVAVVAGLFSALLFAASRYPALDKLIFIEGPPL